MNRREALKTLSTLLGSSVALPIAAGFLAGCGPSENQNSAWRPKALTLEQDQLVTIIAERIIPQTDTPGAAAARVNEFIDLMLHDWFSESEKAVFFKGMEAAKSFCLKRLGREFPDCSEAEQVSVLVDLEKEYLANKTHPSTRAEFFHMMKQFTVVGFYTSEIGASQELRVPPMGQYLGNEPLDENSRAWAW